MPSPVKRPPGPKRLPLIGSLPAMSRDPLGFLKEMASHGPVSYTTIGTLHFNLLSDPALIDEVLIGHHRDCTKDAALRELRALLGDGLITSEGELWKRQRKLASPTLSPKRIAGYADVMVDCASRMFAGFRNGEARDVHVDMMALTLEIVGKTLLGFDVRGDLQRVARVVDVSLLYFDQQLRTWRGILPKWVLTPDRIAFRRARKDLDAIIYRVIERCRRNGEEADHLLGRLVATRDENGEAMSDTQLRDEAVTMLLAGHETTAIALSFAIYMLSEHPAAAARVREELAAKVGDRPVKLSDLAALPLLDAVVRETMRLYPPAWIIGRSVVQPFDLGGYTMARGDQLVMSPYLSQRDPRFFADPERFMPERWLDGKADDLPRFAYFPFGGGPRVCIGNHFATMEVQLVLATLMQRLELTVVPGFQLELEPNVTLRPKSGVHVRVRRLDGARRNVAPLQAHAGVDR